MSILDIEQIQQKNKKPNSCVTKLSPPTSWVEPSTHYLSALDNPWYRLLFKLQASINYYTYMFYYGRQIHSASFPITTGSISSPMGLGSDSIPVCIELAGQPTYLADSMQFMLEYALRFHEKGVFYIMPSFRGEDADPRHLCQFYHSEAEVTGTLEDIMSLVEDYVRFLSNTVLNEHGELLRSLGFGVQHIVSLIEMKKFPRIRFDEALEALDYNPNFISEHPAGFRIVNNLGELELIKIYSGPVWLTHLPQLAVPFYQADENGTEYAMCADLIMGIGETVGAGERHADRDSVLKALEKRSVNQAPYEWYLKMREILPLKTSGFGMGIERYILWLLEHSDIRDCQIIPRFNGVQFSV